MDGAWPSHLHPARTGCALRWIRPWSAGLSLRGLRWGRPDDTVGLATNIGWISAGRRRYLEAGGIGFITGDGRLNYAPEWVTETYYDAGSARSQPRPQLSAWRQPGLQR